MKIEKEYAKCSEWEIEILWRKWKIGIIEILKETALNLQRTLIAFGVNVSVVEINYTPSITRFELQLEQGTRVSKIVGLSNDIKLNLAAKDIRIEVFQ